MPKKKSKSSFLYNILILFFAVIIVGFIYSFVQRSFQNGVDIPESDFQNKPEFQTAEELYEANPVSDITIEVLNGCGEKGIAGITADFLRSEQIDVLRSENADNFDYTNTMLIQHSDNVENLKKVAKILDFDINDSEHVIYLPESESDADLTLLIGSDYRSIKPLRLYIVNL